jgi:hypothetical protein
MNTENQLSARQAYEGSDAAATRSLLKKLETCGHLGKIAAQLFRAQKTSSRAKVYRGGIKLRPGKKIAYRDLAYDKKGEALQRLCELLSDDACELTWGWQIDPRQRRARFVVYVDLPTGQCSFHSPSRHKGPDYLGGWDEGDGSQNAILRFCDALLAKG